MTGLPTSIDSVLPFQEATKRELTQLYRESTEEMGLMGKIGIGAANTTLTGQFFKWIDDPRFSPDPEFLPTQELIDKYAGDIGGEQLDRLVNESGSFGEFVFIADRIREENMAAQQLFDGTITGTIGGLLGVLIPNLVEGVPVTAAATALAGPIGGGAAFADRTMRAKRALGLAKGIGLAGAVEGTAEVLRYQIDPSMTKTDVLLNAATATALGGLVGAAAPYSVFKVAKAIRDEVKLEEALKVRNRFGNETVKAEARTVSKSRIILNTEEVAESGAGVSRLEGRKSVRNYIKSDLINNAKTAVKTAARKITELGGEGSGSIAKKLDDFVQAGFSQLPSKGALTVNRQNLRAVVKSLRETLSDNEAVAKIIKGTERGEQTTLTNELVGMAAELERVAITAVQMDVAKIFRNIATSASKQSDELIPETRDMLKKLSAKIRRNDSFEVTASRVRKSTDPKTRAERFKVIDEGGGEATIHIDGIPVATGSSDLLEYTPEQLAEASLGWTQQRTVSTAGNLSEKVARGTENPLGFISPKMSILTAPATRIAASVDENVRKLGAIFFGGPRQNGSSRPVETIITLNEERLRTVAMRKLTMAKVEAAKKGQKLTDRDIARAVTSQEEVTGEMKQAVDAIREFYSKAYQYGVRGGVFDPKGYDPNYIRRTYAPANTRALVEEFEDGAVERMVTAAIKDNSSIKFTTEQAQKLAKRILAYNNNPDEYGKWRMNNRKKYEVLEDELRKELPGLSDDDLKVVMEMVRPKQINEPHLGMKFRRIPMNENFTTEMVNKQGLTRTVHIDEIFDRNLEHSINIYAQQVVGAVEMRKGMLAYADTAKMGLKEGEVPTVEQVVQHMRKGVGDETAADVAEDTFLHLYRMASGWGYDLDKTGQKLLSGFRDGNALAMSAFGGLMGLTQLAEVPVIMAQQGLAAFAPLSRLSFWRTQGRALMMGPEKIKNKMVYGENFISEGRRSGGELYDDLLAQHEVVFGIGGDVVRKDYLTRRLDEMDIDGGARGALSKFFDTTRQMATMHPFAGLIPVDTMMRRWAVDSAFQGFINRAYRIKGTGAIADQGFWRNDAVEAFRSCGLGDDMIERIIKELTRPEVVKVQKGLLGGHRVKSIDFGSISDQVAMDDFAIAMRKTVDRMVQRQSIGETPKFLQQPFLRSLAQFRVFMLVSQAKQLSYGIASMGTSMGAGRLGMAVLGSAFMGMYTYKLQTHIRALNKPEKERSAYLRERLSKENLRASMITRNTFAGIIPTTIDTGRNFTGYEPLFNQRSTVSASGLLQGTTIASVADRGLKALKEGGSALAGNDPFTAEDAKNTARLFGLFAIPFTEAATQAVLD